MAVKMTQNGALRSDRRVGETPRPVVTNTAVMTRLTLLTRPEQPSRQKHIRRGSDTQNV